LLLSLSLLLLSLLLLLLSRFVNDDEIIGLLRG